MVFSLDIVTSAGIQAKRIERTEFRAAIVLAGSSAAISLAKA
jgi:hypothetical protein